MDDNTVERFIKDVCDARTDVCEQPNGVADEICRSEDTIELAKDFLFVVVHDTRLQIGCSQTHVLDSKRIHLQRSIVDIADGHCHGVEEDSERVPQVQPNKR